MKYNEIGNFTSNYIYILINEDEQICGTFTSYSAALQAKENINDEVEIEKYINGDNFSPNITGFTAYYDIRKSTLEVKENKSMYEDLLSGQIYRKNYEWIFIEIPNATKEEAIERAKQVISIREGIDINTIKYKPSSVEEIFKDF